MDPTNKGLTAVRFAWVTLGSLNKMAEYLQDKFKNVFAGTFVRFLTTQIANINPTGSWKEKASSLDTKLVALGNRLTKVKDEAALKDSLLRVDTKLEAVVRPTALRIMAMDDNAVVFKMMMGLRTFLDNQLRE